MLYFGENSVLPPFFAVVIAFIYRALAFLDDFFCIQVLSQLNSRDYVRLIFFCFVWTCEYRQALAGIDRLLYDHLEQIGYHDLTLVSVLISEEGKVVAFANDDIQYICGDIDQSRSFETFGLIEDDSTPFIGALGSRIPVSG